MQPLFYYRYMEINCSMPLYIELGKMKKKKHHINLNNFRNWHYQVSNNIKKAYQETVNQKLQKLRFSKFKKIKIELTLWKSSKRKIDRANVLSIHEKFFCDALTGLQIIPDDNDTFIESTFYKTGGIDKLNPRVDIKIIVLET